MGSGRGGCSANYWFGRIDRISPHSVPNPKPRVSIFLAICQNIFTVEITSDGSLSSDIGTSPSLLASSRRSVNQGEARRFAALLLD